MHLVIDAVAVAPGSSAIVLEHLIRAWRETWPGDRLTVVTGPGGPAFELPSDVDVDRLAAPLPGPLRGLWLRSFGVRRAARSLRARHRTPGRPMRIRPFAVIAVLASGALLAGCSGGASAAPHPSASETALTLTNCDTRVTFDHAPQRVVSIKSTSTFARAKFSASSVPTARASRRSSTC